MGFYHDGYTTLLIRRSFWVSMLIWVNWADSGLFDLLSIWFEEVIMPYVVQVHSLNLHDHWNCTWALLFECANSYWCCLYFLIHVCGCKPLLFHVHIMLIIPMHTVLCISFLPLPLVCLLQMRISFCAHPICICTVICITFLPISLVHLLSMCFSFLYLWLKLTQPVLIVFSISCKD